jgi:hypothetical protein
MTWWSWLLGEREDREKEAAVLAFRQAMDRPLELSLDGLDAAVAAALKARRLANKTPPPMPSRAPLPSDNEET